MEDSKKNEWQDARIRSSREDIDSIVSGRARTALQNLATRYRQFSNIAFIMIFTMPWVFMSQLIPGRNSLYVVISGMLYFLTCSVMDRWLYNGISRIDCATMSVSEVAGLALFYRKRHIQFIIILLPLAAAWISMLLYFSTSDPFLIYSVACGTVIGLAIGVRQLFKFMNDYRDITE